MLRHCYICILLLSGCVLSVAAQQPISLRIFRDSVLLPDNTVILGPELTDTAQYKLTIEAHLPESYRNESVKTIPIQFYFSNQTGKPLSYYPKATFYHDSRLMYDPKKLTLLSKNTTKAMQLTLYQVSAALFSKTDMLQLQVSGGEILYIPVAFRLIYDQ